MKTIVSLVVLAALCLSVQAAPARSTFYKVLTKAGATDSVQDIWTDCSSSSDPAKVINIIISPDPPKKGVNLNLTAQVTLNEEVTSGQIEIDLKWGFIPINQKVDLCDSLKQSGKSCPLEPGAQTLNVIQQIPSEAPSGHYKGNAYVRDQNGKELVCIALDFRM